ncbi:unnamed protein product [Sphagnum jensenii]|uniref:Uncharacterized protein n=1 Tax=Sphagnum jensenii TaxID=128206 RepID=A0ABP1A0C3_9BRYO
MDHRTLHPDRRILPFKTTGLRFPVSSANSCPVSTHPTKLMASSSLASLGCARRGVSEVVAIERRHAAAPRSRVSGEVEKEEEEEELGPVRSGFGCAVVASSLGACV